MGGINYDEMLNRWRDKVIEKADKYREQGDNYELGSKEYYIHKSFADGLYMSLSMLSLEERKVKRKRNTDVIHNSKIL